MSTHRSLRLLLFVAAFAASPLALEAQPTPGWNRRALGIDVQPSSAGGYDITFQYRIEGSSDSTAPFDFSTEIDLRLNGITVSTTPVPMSVLFGGPLSCGVAACAGSCGEASINGLSTTLLCLDDGSCLCASPPLSVLMPAVSLQPEDEIMVLLRPGPGAVPDTQSTDDAALLTFHWNRKLLGVDFDPLPGGPNLFDVQVQYAFDLGGQANLPVNLGFTLDLLVDGLPQATTDSDDCLIWDISCSCGENDGQPFPLTCSPLRGCTTDPLTLTFPMVPIPPGVQVGVTLVPVPGALPELPGFPGDDELFIYPFVRGDCNDDGGKDIADAIFLIGHLFPPQGQMGNQLHCDDACDGNNDGGLDIADVIRILNSLFGNPPQPLDPPDPCGSDTEIPFDTLGCDLFNSCAPT